jgi:hypothetical protein
MRLRRKNKGEYCIKTWKHCTLIGILYFFILVFGFNCSSNSLSGTWENSFLGLEPKNATMEFSGNNFTITEYPSYIWVGIYDWDISIITNYYQEWIDYLSFLPNTKATNRGSELISKYEYNFFDIGKLRLIESFPADSFGDASGFRENKRFSNVSKGIYTISNKKIKLKFFDGSKEVYSFSRNENTITIAGESFTRRR